VAEGSGSTAARPVALVTGASSGIGRGLAARLSRKGYAVALVARRGALLRELQAEIEGGGGIAISLVCDVADRDEALEAVARCASELGPVDLLVANAGIGEMTEVASLDSREVAKIMGVNLMGAVHFAEGVLPSMLERDRGHLVVVGSLSGFGGLPKTAAYSASKAALHNFFESLRLDLRHTGVDVTVLKPGYVRTPLTDRNRHSMPGLMELDDALDRMIRGIDGRVPEVRFPPGLSTLLWIAQLFPRRLYDLLASKRKRDKARGRSADS
jgi:short-subunit dehydrogenase